MRERVRDKSRDDLTYVLNSLGVEAEMAERGRREEKIENSWYQKSLGVIDIAEGPIKWINILKKDGNNNSGPRWWVVMGIPETINMPGFKKTKLKTVRKKTFPIFGKVGDVVWKGEGGTTGLASTLSMDQDVKILSKRIGNLEIKSHSGSSNCESCGLERTAAEFFCTSCGGFIGFQGWTLIFDRRFSPTNIDWEVIRKISDYILLSPRTL